MKDKDLSALVFELQRARTPVEKVRGLARAWRTIRGLKSMDRRLLAREVGLDGAEDLVEGLAGKGGGIFAPAAVLEALGKMRLDEGLTVRSILSDLRDPERRDDLLIRGIDLAADSFDDVESGNDEPAAIEEPEVYDIPTSRPVAEIARRELELESINEDVSPEVTDDGHGDWKEPMVPPPPPLDTIDAESHSDPESFPESSSMQEPEGSPLWDDVWQHPGIPEKEEDSPRMEPAVEVLQDDQPVQVEGSVLQRLGAFRAAIPALRGSRSVEILETLSVLPEPWARRRAVVALIEAGIPGDADRALDIIEEMERPMDRRWCLATLARHGDLEGDALERALEMLVSPAARRRVAAIADAAG